MNRATITVVEDKEAEIMLGRIPQVASHSKIQGKALFHWREQSGFKQLTCLRCSVSVASSPYVSLDAST